MPIELNSERAVCFKCGTAYGRRKGYFPVSYSVQAKGVGYLPVCKQCIDTMYNTYLATCKNPKDAVRQMCRKLDLYWSESVFEIVSRKNTERSMMTQYIAKVNSINYAGKSYDDTLIAEGTLWNFGAQVVEAPAQVQPEPPVADDTPEEEYDISDDVRAFWGSGYTPAMYAELEQRRSYWMSRFPDDVEIDIGTEAIIRQICSLELDINRDRASGKSVEKSVTALNALLGSANLKPAQKKQEDANSGVDNTPFGVWIKRWEDQRPVPEPDPELQDVDKIVRYIEVWFKGHLSKMLGLKNAYSKLYQKEIDKMRVDKPEYEDEDDEAVFEDEFDTDGQDDTL